MRFYVILSFVLTSSLNGVAQNAYVKLGYQAFMEKDFKTAVRQLEKACMVDSNNTNAMWMLGYSYYHSQNYKKSVVAYTKVLDVNPLDDAAYYFRSKARSNMAKDADVAPADKEKCLLAAIKDLTKALSIKKEEDRFYQNRGLAYREYAIFKLQPNPQYNDKRLGINALKAAIADFEKVLASNPSRMDIASLLALSKEKLATVEGHR